MKGLILDFKRTIFDPDTEKLLEGVTSVLSMLHEMNVPVCLVSSNEDPPTRRKLITELGLDEYLTEVFVVTQKTESLFLECCDVMGSSPRDTVVVGDKVTNEIILGNKLGMTTVWCKWGKNAARLPQNELETPDHVITQLRGIKKMVWTAGFEPA